MSLSPREAFKAGFLARCLDDGLTADQIAGRAEKAAAALEKVGSLGQLAGQAVSLAGKAVGGLAGYGVPLAIAGPPVLGGVAGYGLARATDIDPSDVDDVKDREVVDEYRRQADRLRRQTAARDYRRARARTGRMFF
jgi:hypothetical protein